MVLDGFISQKLENWALPSHAKQGRKSLLCGVVVSWLFQYQRMFWHHCSSLKLHLSGKNRSTWFLEGAQKGAGKLDLQSRYYFVTPQEKDRKSPCAPQNWSEIRILRSWSAILPTFDKVCYFLKKKVLTYMTNDHDGKVLDWPVCFTFAI